MKREDDGMREAQGARPVWGSRLGFILAAAGSAIGLGNIWKFPYITGENGGGLFVLIYLGCVALVGLPIMVAEVLLGRASRQSPVGAFENLSGRPTAWSFTGWLGVGAGFIILSYYSVVAGWALNYILLSLMDRFRHLDAQQTVAVFDQLYTAGDITLFWHLLFLPATVGVVMGGVRRGIERACRLLMPALFVIIVLLVGYSVFLPNQGFLKALDFTFTPHPELLTRRSVLEALGHAFFTLSLGMGAMLTYGSYLDEKADLVRSSVQVVVLDSLIALLACLMVYPVLFSFGLPPAAGPGLVFKSLPMLLSQLPGGLLLALMFFTLIAFAALTSAISLLEVVSATLIDRLGWTRQRAALVAGGLICAFGIPSALSGDGRLFGAWAEIFGHNFFDTMDYLASNWMLPMGGLAIALYTGWVLPDSKRRAAFGAPEGGRAYGAFVLLLRWVTPVMVLLVLLHKIGLLQQLGVIGS
jgi:NSS family neurotransmitter:Na+ symporter